IRNEAPHSNPSPEIRAQSALSLLLGLSMMRRFADTDFLAFSETSLRTTIRVSFNGLCTAKLVNHGGEIQVPMPLVDECCIRFSSNLSKYRGGSRGLGGFHG